MFSSKVHFKGLACLVVAVLIRDIGQPCFQHTHLSVKELTRNGMVVLSSAVGNVQCDGNRMTAQGLDNYGSKAIYSVGASVGLSESSNTMWMTWRAWADQE